MIARYAAPLCYNFLSLIKLRSDQKTVFEEVSAVPFLGALVVDICSCPCRFSLYLLSNIVASNLRFVLHVHFFLLYDICVTHPVQFKF